MIAIIIIALLIAVFVCGKEKQKKDRNNLLAKIRAQAETCDKYQKMLFSAESVSEFFQDKISLESNLDLLFSYYGVNKAVDKVIDSDYSRIQTQYSELKKDLQWLLRNAIERQSNRTIYEIKTTYKNSKQHKLAAYLSFCDEMKAYENWFSEETKECAEDYAEKIYKSLGMATKKVDLFPNIESSGRFLEEKADSSEIEKTDSMEGHEFEHWCAKLLKESGYKKVSVTQESGDQGVDILAEKEGIRYAIQCKCFANPLGNKPVQEVHAGKDIYHCHVGVVMTNSTFTPGAIEAAEHTNTLLWDRQSLERMLKTRKKCSDDVDQPRCPKCGKQIKGTEKYCAECGTKI